MSYPVTTSGLSVFTVLQSCIMQVLGLDINHVIQGRQNGVAMPKEPFVIMTATLQKGLSTFDSIYNSTADTQAIATAYDQVFQMDCYSAPGASQCAQDMALTLSTFFNSSPACDFFDAWVAANGTSAIEPLYAEDPTSMAFTNEENQFEQRYTLKVHINVTNSVTIPMQFMTQVTINLKNIQPK